MIHSCSPLVPPVHPSAGLQLIVPLEHHCEIGNLASVHNVLKMLADPVTVWPTTDAQTSTFFGRGFSRIGSRNRLQGGCRNRKIDSQFSAASSVGSSSMSGQSGPSLLLLALPMHCPLASLSAECIRLRVTQAKNWRLKSCSLLLRSLSRFFSLQILSEDLKLHISNSACSSASQRFRSFGLNCSPRFRICVGATVNFRALRLAAQFSQFSARHGWLLASSDR